MHMYSFVTHLGHFVTSAELIRYHVSYSKEVYVLESQAPNILGISSTKNFALVRFDLIWLFHVQSIAL